MRSILLIDEDKIYADVLCINLKRFGADISVKHETFSRWERMWEGKYMRNFDLLLVDEMNGARVFKKNETQIPIVLLSNHHGKLMRENRFLNQIHNIPYVFKYQRPERLMGTLQEMAIDESGYNQKNETITVGENVYDSRKEEILGGAMIYGIMGEIVNWEIFVLANGLAKIMAQKGHCSLYLDFQRHPRKIQDLKINSGAKAVQFLCYELVYGEDLPRQIELEKFIALDQYGAHHLLYDTNDNPLLSLDKRELKLFFQGLKYKLGYEYVFINLPSENDYTREWILEHCDQTILIEECPGTAKRSLALSSPNRLFENAFIYSGWETADLLTEKNELGAELRKIGEYILAKRIVWVCGRKHLKKRATKADQYA